MERLGGAAQPVCGPTLLLGLFAAAHPLPCPTPSALQHNVRDWLRVIASNKDRSGEQRGGVLLLHCAEKHGRAERVAASSGLTAALRCACSAPTMRIKPSSMSRLRTPC